MMHENASTHHWQIQNYNALHTQYLFEGQKSTGISQHLFWGELQLFSPLFPHFRFNLNSSWKAFSTMHEEKWKALSFESLEEDKVNINNKKICIQ